MPHESVPGMSQLNNPEEEFVHPEWISAEKPYKEERGTEEQKLQIEHMKTIASEFGFISSSDLDRFRYDVAIWQDKAFEINNRFRQTLNLADAQRFDIGHKIALASVYYEQRNPQLYFETMDEALEEAEQFKLEDIVQKIRSLE